ncbi:MAG: HAMP domain-containing protein, partial [Spirochaetaceae bacterium]|nr:HAMP domain-containing protein [Spirochaetaceae bacterium]
MSIFKKLILGFLSVSVLVLAAGLIGLFSMNRLARDMDEVMLHEMPLADLTMESIISSISIRDAAGEYQLNSEGLDEIGHELDMSIKHLNAWLGILRYGSDSDIFRRSEAGRFYAAQGLDISSEAVPPEMTAEVDQAISLASSVGSQVMAMRNTHDERISFNFDYNDRSWDIDNFLTLVELQHKNWIDTLYTDASANRNFTGQGDPTQCFFGKWYYAYEVEDPELKALLLEFEEVHNSLHAQAELINSQPSRDAKLGVYDSSVIPIKNTIEQRFRSMESHIAPMLAELRSNEITEMNRLDEASLELNSSLERMESVVLQRIDQAKDDAAKARRESTIFLLITVVVSIVIALVIGIVIALNISRPLKQVTNISESIALGDLSKEIPDIRSRDEVGVLARSFGRMAAVLREKADVLQTMASKDLS